MIYQDPRLSALGIVHGTTARSLGNMRLAENTQSLWQQLHIHPNRVLRFKQIHSDTLIACMQPIQAQQIVSAPIAQADGWILAAKGWGAAIITADCVRLFIWDSHARVLGLSHCGWRGVAAQLPAKTALQIQQTCKQKDLFAWIGPHIQSCCFEVQTDVANQFPHACLQRQERIYVDLTQEITRQLTDIGLPISHIHASEHCTCCETENFFSFRRDHSQEAMLSFVYLPD